MTSDRPDIRVLVLDDEPAICRIVAQNLKRHGFDVDTVSDPEQINEGLSRGPFDIVLLDCSMCDSQGTDLLDLVREQAPQAKVLYFTGQLVDESEASRVDGVVLKPISSKQLTEALHKVL